MRKWILLAFVLYGGLYLGWFLQLDYCYYRMRSASSPVIGWLLVSLGALLQTSHLILLVFLWRNRKKHPLSELLQATLIVTLVGYGSYTMVKQGMLRSDVMRPSFPPEVGCPPEKMVELLWHSSP